jgi:hypothetical protein
MRSTRVIVGLVVVIGVVLAGYLTFRSYELLGQVSVANVKEVPAGDQEVAWMAPATSDENWERLVAAVRFLVREWPRMFPDEPPLLARLDRAFLDLTADVPEVGLSFAGGDKQTLWIRWYKLSSEVEPRQWLDKLNRRATPPLAIVGGETSDRAVNLGRALEELRTDWKSAAPLFLITTATADRYYPDDYQPGQDDNLTERTWPRLMEAYKERSFRYSFTNTRMAEAVMNFVQEHPEIWLPVRSDPAFLAGIVAQGSPIGFLSGLAAGGYLQPLNLYTLAWSDDRYSKDLADRFGKVFTEGIAGAREAENGSGPRVSSDSIQYGVGDYYLPNPREAQAAGRFLANSARFRQQHQILLLPAGAQQARRFLRILCGMGPMEVRNVVVMSGDSISFNNIYRDRDLAWNILDMPVPLVFFCHRNPVNEAAGFGRMAEGENNVATTATNDLLLYADVVASLVQAARQDGRWLADADAVRERLRQARWSKGRVYNPAFSAKAPAGPSLFDAEGDRNSRTGEHVVWLRPAFSGDVTLPQATITVWRGRADATPGRGWHLARPPLDVIYNTSQGPGISIHASE